MFESVYRIGMSGIFNDSKSGADEAVRKALKQRTDLEEAISARLPSVCFARILEAIRWMGADYYDGMMWVEPLHQKAALPACGIN